MTNKCTYLTGKDVLPKNSLIYSEYMVWNEINNIKVGEEKLPVDIKQALFENLLKEEANKKKRHSGIFKIRGNRY